MADFVKGMKIKEVKTQYGGLIKISINKKEFLQNSFNGEWLNIDLKRSKESKKLYATINDWKPNKENENIVEFDDEEIPF